MTSFLGPAEGRRLLDIAGGTGNYTAALQGRGFDVVIADLQPAMVARSLPKIGPGRQVVADATALPFRDRRFDRAAIVTAIHLIRPPERALAEARRVLREGPLVVVAFTLENVGPLFIREYFPTAQIPFDENPPREQLLSWMRGAGFRRVEWAKFVYTDSVDGTLVSLHTDPIRLAGRAYLRNTSFFQRVPEPARAEGLTRLGQDLRSGVLEARVKEAYRQSLVEGHGAVIACWP
jgi:SAM-dependent methyltransferase